MHLTIALAVLAAFIIGILALYRSGLLPGTLPYWTKQLAHPDRATRLKTAHLLGQIATPQAAYCLAQVAQNEDATLKLLALKGLLNTRLSSTLPVLRAALADRDPKVRRIVAQGLAGFQGVAVTAMLTELLTDLDEFVVMAATESLGSRQDPSAARSLALALGHSEETARFAAEALMAIGPSVFEPLCTMIDELNPLACERLIPVLVSLDPRRAIEPLIQILNGTVNDYLIKATISALIELRSPEVAQALIAYVSDESHYCRPFALRKLQALEDPAANDLLLRLLSDRDVMIRRAASDALAVDVDPERLPALLAALGDGDAEVLQNVIRSLGHYNDPRILPRLFETLWPSEYETIVPMIEDACRRSLSELSSVDELLPLLRRISSREARGSEEQRIRHYLQSVYILLRPRLVCGFHDLTNNILIFKDEDLTSEYQEQRLHPLALSSLLVHQSHKSLNRWKNSLR
ncbi:MAG TPA: HEAT repeat domain-containing protein [Pantanalinema sp.]